MPIEAKKGFSAMRSELQRLQREHSPNKRLDPTTIKNKGLQELVSDLQKEVSSGCGASSVKNPTLASVRKALDFIGSAVKFADRDGDGVIAYDEESRISPLAARMLQLASKAERPARRRPAPRTVDTSSRNVSTGCGGGGSAAPVSRPVSSGC